MSAVAVGRLLAVFCLSLLCACAGSLKVAGEGGQVLTAYTLDARFALRVGSDANAQSYSGRMTWTHAATGDHVLIADPFGRGLAELWRDRDGARLKMADGKTRSSADAGELLREATGFPFPLAQLADWLAGRGSPEAQITRDASGRVARLVEKGWEITYGYEDETSLQRLPARLTARRGEELELRVRIETWQLNPQNP